MNIDGIPHSQYTYDTISPPTGLDLEKAGSADRGKMAEALRAVASAPGVKIGPGEWEKAKALIAEGKDID